MWFLPEWLLDIVTTFSGCGLIFLTPEQLWISDPRATLDVLISFLILLIFLEKKEANTCCLRAFQLGGFVSLSPVSKCVHVLFKFLFIIFKKKVC